jgi:DNA-binding NarL/FixJ family response regulator
VQQAPVRVFVVDDHAVVRRGLRAYLESVEDMEVVGEAADGQEALEESRRWSRPSGRPMWC